MTKLPAGFTVDSREVKPDFAFVAIKGALQDGHHYIKDAINNGAKFIIHQDEVEKDPSITYIKVADARLFLSELAANSYPEQPKYILGVTGTSGKSSTVHFVREILHLLKKKAVSIGTMGVLGDLEVASSLTTPSAQQLHQILQNAVKNKIDYIAMECSSHGIEQHRLASVNFTACAFTNFSQDHLDYHHSMEEYFATKLKLFALMNPGYAVLNSDIPEFEALKQACSQHKLICYGKKACEEAEHNIIISAVKKQGVKQQVSWKINGQNYKTLVNLVGEFQIYNLAAAIGLLLSTGIAINKIIPQLKNLNTVTGRMDLIATHNGASIFVDYAHKPDALMHALRTLRQATDGNLWVIFGCGGDRDQEKRKIMGKIACDEADKIIVTDDNPRTEDPSAIRHEILQGCNDKAIEVLDRKEAIAYALSQLKPGDNLIVAGKGHENYQIIGKEKLNFSDIDTIKACII